MNQSSLYRFYIVITFMLAMLAAKATLADCPAVPLAWPSVPGTVEFCQAGYGGLQDTIRREPVAVEYVLTADHSTHGCLRRTGLSFKVDPLLPATQQGRSSDYAGSGYDLGHMANNEDFAWDQGEQRDTFSMLNVVPQLPTLNRLGWESGEDWTRAAAFAVGELTILTGPIFDNANGTIGSDTLPIPIAFFKVLIDTQQARAFAFIMQNQPTPKTHTLEPYRVSLAMIQQRLGWPLPVPDGVDETSTWSVDLDAWRAAHRAACEVNQ